MADNIEHDMEAVLLACEFRDLGARFLKFLEPEYRLECCYRWRDALEAITRNRYPLVLLDPLLCSDNHESALGEIFSASPDSRIILLESAAGPRLDQMALFKKGVHGFCRSDISPGLLLKAVNAVISGELWIQRSLITRVIDEMARNRSPAASNKIKCLTPRELEVARMVHMGGNNKTIARKLDISERTVKAHLSAIFRKLEIENRLHLALFFNDVN